MKQNRQENDSAPGPMRFSVILSIAALWVGIGTATPHSLFRSWTVENGLPQNTISCVTQSSDGYLWLGTPSGLVRFDGIRFTRFTKLNTPALGNDRITALHGDPAGILWIGTDGGGVYAFDRDQWTAFNHQDGLSYNHVRAIVSDHHGNIWVGTDYGLNCITDQGIEVLSVADGLADHMITALEMDPGGRLWVGTFRGGLTRIHENGSLRSYGAAEGLQNLCVQSLASDAAGNLWIGTLRGLYVKAWNEEMIQAVPGTAYSPVTSLLITRQNQLLLGAPVVGARMIIDNAIAEIPFPPNLYDRNIHCMYESTDGALWFGTGTHGLLQRYTSNVRGLSAANGLPQDAITALLQTEPGTFWAGTKSSGLYLIESDTAMSTLSTATGLPGNDIRALYQDSQKRIWVSTQQNGLSLLWDRKLLPLPAALGKLQNPIHAIMEDSQGMLFFAEDTVLHRYDGNELHSMALGSHQNRISALGPARDGQILVGTQQGLYLPAGHTLQKMTPDSLDAKLAIAALWQDSTGTIWIGTDGYGLQRWHDQSWTMFTSRDGLFCDYISSIWEDEQGRLWLGSLNGILVYPKEQLNAFLDHMGPAPIPMIYTESEGLPSRQCSRTGTPNRIPLATGEIAYASIDGIGLIEPSEFDRAPYLPRCQVESVSVDGYPIAVSDSLQIPFRHAQIRFAFTAFDFRAPDKTHFRYQLQGHNQTLRTQFAGQTRSVLYSRLSPGSYRFLLTAINNAGIESSTKTVVLTVIRPFYRKPLGILLSLFALAACTGFAILLQQKIRKARQPVKYSSTRLSTERRNELLPSLLQVMEREKIYRDPMLTLTALARKLRIHPNQLSQIINAHFEMNFNDFINRYRIEEAKQMLSSPRQSERTVLEILYAVGFNSKSVFNTAFKKQTGMTPREFRKQQL